MGLAGKMIGSVVVVSKRSGARPAYVCDVTIDIDRSNLVLGNRHVMINTNDEEERGLVVSKYEIDLDADFECRGPMFQAVTQIASRVRMGKTVALRCWCAPRRCHGDVLKSRIYRMCGFAEAETELQAVQADLFK